MQGAYGQAPEDCASLRAGQEGGYVVFKKRSAGAGGEGGCDFTRIERQAPDRYVLTGMCFGLEGPRQRRTVPLVIHGPREISYGGTRMSKCDP